MTYPFVISAAGTRVPTEFQTFFEASPVNRKETLKPESSTPLSSMIAREILFCHGTTELGDYQSHSASAFLFVARFSKQIDSGWNGRPIF